jgi:hypothetical protein
MEILDGIILFSRNIDCIALQYITATLRYITLHYITYIHIQYIYIRLIYIYYTYFCNTYEYAVILRVCSAQCSPAGRGRGASGPVASGIGEFLSGGGWDQRLCDRHL